MRKEILLPALAVGGGVLEALLHFGCLPERR